MITSIRMRNFKAFQDTQEVQFAPLTVLTGPNGSGKSAGIRALMALRQTIESLDSSAAFVPIGTYVDLGPFQEFVYQRNTRASITFDIDFQVPAGRTPVIGFPINILQTERRISLHVDLKYIRSTDKIYLAESHIVSKNEEAEISVTKSSKGGKALGRSYRTVVKIGQSPEISLSDSSNAKFAGTPLFELKSIDSMSRGRNEQRFIATQLLKALEDLVREEFSRIRYIGPLRARPQRIYLATGESPVEVGSSGDLGPAVLWAASEIVGLDLENRLSHWCSRMGLAQEIHLATIYGSYFELHLVDPYTGTHINLPDVGFGTSQILPILIQGLVATPGSTILLEQPEIHLHPRVQAELADFLIDVSNRGIGVVVETHSEHLITRLQRRIADETLVTDNLALYYLSPSESGSHFEKVEIDEFGQIGKAPEGFFEEGFEETFSMMNAIGSRKGIGPQAKLID